TITTKGFFSFFGAFVCNELKVNQKQICIILNQKTPSFSALIAAFEPASEREPFGAISRKLTNCKPAG
ncbi:MAG: hypothetical protein D6714_07465, partial [Bacteroidetes bacterium]